MDVDLASDLVIRCAKNLHQPHWLGLSLHFNRVDRVVKKPLPPAIILEAKSTKNLIWCTSQCRLGKRPHRVAWTRTLAMGTRSS